MLGYSQVVNKKWVNDSNEEHYRNVGPKRQSQYYLSQIRLNWEHKTVTIRLFSILVCQLKQWADSEIMKIIKHLNRYHIIIMQKMVREVEV